MSKAKKVQSSSQQRTLWQETWRRFKKNKLAVAGMIFLIALVVIAIATIIIDAVNPSIYETYVIKQNLRERLAPPSAAHIFGQDEFGRDMLIRILWSIRSSLFMGALSIALSCIVGGLFGAIAGYYGGKLDNVIMRIMDVFLAIPSMLLAIAIVAAFGTSLVNVLLAIGISYVPTFARTVRAPILTVKGQDYIEAAKARGEALDHLLFYGPPGLGKTTLAGIIANEMNVNMKITSGPAIEKPGEMAAILNNLQEGDVLFVDEIHRLNRQVEEVLYPAMEDYAIDIMIGKGASARSIRLDLPKFTLVGATTRAGMLTAPLRDRFGVVTRMEYYTVEELKMIILRSAKVLEVGIDENGAYAMARRSRGTPRLANRLLKRVRDFAQVKYDGYITEEVADYALDLLDVDKEGLDQTDRGILLAMIGKFGGGPVGLETLAASIGEDPGTIEDVYEPYLLKNGFIQRTPRGRVVTDAAYAHLGICKENE